MDDIQIRNIILNQAGKDKQIIHGTRAYNMQSPPSLARETKDYDILTKKPEESANKLADRLNKLKYKDVSVSKGLHEGTYKVKIDKQTIADYTELKKRPKTKDYWGVKIKSLGSIKGDAQRLVKDPATEFRRAKDLDTLDRIKRIKESNKRFEFK